MVMVTAVEVTEEMTVVKVAEVDLRLGPSASEAEELLQHAKQVQERFDEEELQEREEDKRKAAAAKAKKDIAEQKKQLAKHKRKKRAAMKGKLKSVQSKLNLKRGIEVKEPRNKLSLETEHKYGRILSTVISLTRTLDEIENPGYSEISDWLSSSSNYRNASMWIGAMFSVSTEISPMTCEPGSVLAAFVLDLVVRSGSGQPSASNMSPEVQQAAMEFMHNFHHLRAISARLWRKKGEADPGTMKIYVSEEDVKTLEKCLDAVSQPFVRWASMFKEWEDGRQSILIKSQCFAPLLTAVGLIPKATKGRKPRKESFIAAARQKNYEKLVKQKKEAERIVRLTAFRASHGISESSPSSSVGSSGKLMMLPKLDPAGKAVVPRRGRKSGGWRLASKGFKIDALSLSAGMVPMTSILPVPPTRSMKSSTGSFRKRNYRQQHHSKLPDVLSF